MTAATHTLPRSHSSERSPLSSNEKIDICRGLFAFLVVGAHAVDISWVIHPEVPGRFPGWLHNFLLYVVAAGVYWVIGFFAISGYCIQLSVERQIEGNAFPLRHYLLARLTRIAPLYYLALLLAVVIERLVATARPSCWPQGMNVNGLIAQLFIIQNLTWTYGSFAPSWSITNEMFYYLFYGVVVCVALRFGIRPTSMGMSLCLVLALILDWVYFFEYRTGYVLSPGLLFGLGIIWFQGALVAEHREWLHNSQAARMASALWPLVLILAMAMWYSQGIHLQVVYLVLGVAFTLMLMRFVVTEPRRVKPTDRGRGSTDSLAGPGELPDLSVPRPDRDAHRLHHSEVESGQRLEVDLGDSDQRGDRLGHSPGPLCRTAYHGLACRILETTEAITPGTGAWRGIPDSRHPAVRSVNQRRLP